jgi:oxalate decarboxylase/phosphoglucose isomerase-like protein (cupin superfamily)
VGFYILEGELEFTVGAERIVAPAGTWVMVPIGVTHTFGNARAERVRFLATMSPDFYVRYFEEIAPLFAAGPPDPAAVGEIMARYATEAQIGER